mmetsp:Transcript_19222/g.43984  ORF Transcript_19222/g.43984 Transcript_19222/m.43984 type:complete len:914 (-) Transcript_19222:182-2923(-)
MLPGANLIHLESAQLPSQRLSLSSMMNRSPGGVNATTTSCGHRVRLKFKSFEDFSSRVLLVPFDEDFIGAKVAAAAALADEERDTDVDETTADNGISKSPGAIKETSQDEHLASTSCDTLDSDDMKDKPPEGYILVEIIIQHEKQDQERVNIERVEFSEILSEIRSTNFPAAMVFAHHPVEDESPPEESDNDNSLEESTVDSCTSTETNSEQTHATDAVLSREEAARLAKQAALQLGGRLSRWGYSAAAQVSTKATEAASAMQEIRDERNRKLKEDKQNRDSENRDSNVDVEQEGKLRDDDESEYTEEQVGTSELSIRDCKVYLQSSSGFIELTSDYEGLTITNMSLISVRLSIDKGCPVGTDGYSFQWFREKDDDADEWTSLDGCSYAMYQPSVSDAGCRLKCIINHGEKQKICHIHHKVSVDSAQFDAARSALLEGKRCCTFGNLAVMNEQSFLFIKVEVTVQDDFISGQKMYIEKITGGSKADAIFDKAETVTNFQAVADPSKPKVFYLVTSDFGKVALVSANRKSRETLLISLGLANFAGRLSTLSPHSDIYPCSSVAKEISTLPPLSCNGDGDINRLQKIDLQLQETTLLLAGKNASIGTLQVQLAASDGENRRLEDNLAACQDELRLSHDKLKEQEDRIRELESSERQRETAHSKAVKALRNEKAVLQAAVDAREGKIDVLRHRLAEMEESASVSTDQLATIERISSELKRTREQCSTADKVVEKMKTAELELSEDLQHAQDIAVDLNARFEAATDSAAKCQTELRRLKLEKNSLKNINDGLSKELHRMSKHATDSLELSKLHKAMEKIQQELETAKMRNESLQKQIWLANTEKRSALEKLEATSIAHQQLVSYQIAKDGRSGSASDARVVELEIVVSNLTEHLEAKEMQMTTYRQLINDLASEASP